MVVNKALLDRAQCIATDDPRLNENEALLRCRADAARTPSVKALGDFDKLRVGDEVYADRNALVV